MANKLKHPNVLFIAFDDLNDWTGFMGGHPQTQTPNLDAFAKEGVVFMNAHCASSECNPSRISMLTGYHSKTTGFTNNFLPIEARQWKTITEDSLQIPGYKSASIPNMSEVKMLPQWFREHGYFTMGCGKIFHHNDSLHVDREKSWDKWADPSGFSLFVGSHKSEIYDGKVNWLDWGPANTKTGATDDYLRAEWGAEQLNTYQQDKPFFLAVGFKKPHDPFIAPQEIFDRFPAADQIKLPPIYDNGIDDNDLSDLPPKARIMADKKDGVVSEYEIIKGNNKFGKDYRQDVVRSYLATINYVDSCVAVVLNALNNSQFKENTIVVVWSDHGWHLGEKLHYHKFTFWEEAIRTVLVIKAPGYKKGYCKQNVSAIDIFPTLVDLCSLPNNYLDPKFNKQGNSLVPLLKDKAKQWCVPSLITDFKRFPPMLSRRQNEKYTNEFLASGLKTESWKLMEYIDIVDPTDRQYELYNLKSDPNEWNNLSEKTEFSSIKKKLIELLHKFPGGEDGFQKTNSAPTVILTSNFRPEINHNNSEITVTAEVSDIDSPFDVKSVAFYRNGVLLSTDTTYPYSVKVKRNGLNEIKAIASDIAGSVDQDRISFNF